MSTVRYLQKSTHGNSNSKSDSSGSMPCMGGGLAVHSEFVTGIIVSLSICQKDHIWPNYPKSILFGTKTYHEMNNETLQKLQS